MFDLDIAYRNLSESQLYNVTMLCLGFSHRGQNTATTNNLRQVRDRQTIQTSSSGGGGGGGVLKLNVAIAGEFSMGNFGNNQQQ